MNQPGHAKDAQLERYLQQTDDFEDEHRWVELHLFDCAVCRERALDLGRVYFAPLRSFTVSKEPYPGCPDETTLQNVAAGISPPETAAHIRQHADQCEWCGPILKRYVEEFSPELQSEDRELLGQLQSSQATWQKKIVRQWMPQSKGARPRFFNRSAEAPITWWPRATALAAGVAVVIGGLIQGPAVLAKYELRRAQNLVSAAYEERRTTEMRLLSVHFAQYNPLPTEMGTPDKRDADNASVALLAAREALAKKTKSGPLSGPWVDIQGQILLLQMKPDDAVEVLEKAHAEDPDKPRLNITLAASRFEQDSRADHPNLAKTIDLLKGVADNPRADFQERSVALFDLAIAYEKSQMWDLAVVTWKEYLKLDPKGQWSGEAAERLHRAESKSSVRMPPDYKLPSFLLAHSSDYQLQDDVEEYQEIALREWLPQALEKPESNSVQALHRLADLLALQHSDPWLNDFLLSLRRKDLFAVQALGAAIGENRKSHNEEAARQAMIAAHFFAQRRNFAGELRAQFEAVYAQQRILHGKDCFTRAAALEKRMAPTSYRWLQAQLALEKASCSNLLGNFADILGYLNASRGIGEQFIFPGVLIREAGFRASIQRLQKSDDAWAESVHGLGLYWRGAYPIDRLVNSYSVLASYAEDKKLPYLQEALLQQTIVSQSRESDENTVIAGILHKELANVLLTLNRNAAAVQENAVGDELLKNPPSEITAQAYRLSTDISLAEILMRHGEISSALEMLQPAGDLLSTVPDRFSALNWHRVMGTLDRQSGRLDQAAAQYKVGIEIAEESLRTITDESSRLKWVTGADESYRGWIQVLLEQKKDRQALQLWEWYKSRPLSEAGIPGAKPAFNQDFSAASPGGEFEVPLSFEQTPRIVFATFDSGVQIWLVHGTDVATRWVPVDRNSLQGLTSDLAGQCITPGSNLADISSLGQKLYALLFEPVMAGIPHGSKVIIELDRMLAALPVAALKDSAGRYFGETYAIIQSPGMAIENTLRHYRVSGSRTSVLLLDAVPPRGSGYLPGSEAERDTIAKLFPATRVMNSARFTRTNFRRELAPSQIFHFIGHGKSGVSLLISETESLQAQDFSPQLLKHSELAVLAACSSGAKGEDAPWQTSKLVQAFLSAGVPNIVASSWNVDSQSTATLMQNFYHHLEAGETPDLALLHAQELVLSLHPHPYYWAGFSVVGRNN